MRRRKNGHSAIEVLEQDHEKVLHLLERLTDTTERAAKTRTRLVDEIQNELKMHTTIEEEIFYPAFHECAEDRDDEELFFEAEEEHHLIDVELPELIDTDPSTVEFAARASVLAELVRHHIKEERESLFPRMRELFGRNELDELGMRLLERKKSLSEHVKKAA